MDNCNPTSQSQPTPLSAKEEKGESLYLSTLKENWGYDSFRGIQLDIIKSISSGHDTLGLMPTGGGKSITFQVPALSQPGICLVITPLIALMKDQVLHLRQRGIKAAAIYSGLTHEQIIATLENCIFGDYKLLYISPERIGSELFQTKLRHMRVSFICVDEAHCISQWGHEFRPSYLEIRQLRHLLPDCPVLALTATATKEVIEDIMQQLEFRHKEVFRMSFERPNINYHVMRAQNKEKELHYLLDKYDGCTIVYCRNRRFCQTYAEQLKARGHTATYYHAGLTATQRDANQKLWQTGKARIMVATNAFGMGIDKPDVRLVAHVDLPDAIESYYQEAGRAGRDGLPSNAILLTSSTDVKSLRRHVDESFPDRHLIAIIYEEVCCYLHIALGFGAGTRKEFNVWEYCHNFRRPHTVVCSTLTLLTKAGYINFTNEDDETSRLKFNLEREELYRLHDPNPDYDSIMQALLRNYSGLFIDYVYIDETTICKATGLPEEVVYHSLVELSKRNILSYIPRRSVPHISFVRDRVEAHHIRIPAKYYEQRKECLKRRAEAMIAYVEEDGKCRNRMLLEYFDEHSSKNCHHCDYCLQHADKQTRKELQQQAKAERERTRQVLAERIREAGAIHPFNIDLTGISPTIASEIISEMLDEEDIAIDDNGCIYLTKRYDANNR